MQKIIYPSAVAGEITAPSSKSYAQRALAIALLAEGRSTLRNMGLCRDTEAVIDTIQKLGAKISSDGSTYIIDGGLNPVAEEVNIGESGLATRLFAPIVSLLYTPVTITGHGSILKRPVSMMEKPLGDLGVSCTTNGGFLPMTVCGTLQGGEIHVDGSLSSQFISGLLIALSVARCDTVLHVKDLKSKPYIDMTLEAISAFGLSIEHDNYKTFYIRAPRYYTATDYNIEGDWSGASCLLVAGATAGDISVSNLNPQSKQADRAIIDALNLAGAAVSFDGTTCRVSKSQLKAFEFDATDCPDLFPALVTLAASAKGISTIKGASRLTHKESDRATTLSSEFGHLGINVDISESDIMRIEGGAIHGGTVSSHNDHRIAMAAAAAALSADGAVTIEGAEAVEKSYPGFWDDMAKIVSNK